MENLTIPSADRLSRERRQHIADFILSTKRIFALRGELQVVHHQFEDSQDLVARGFVSRYVTRGLLPQQLVDRTCPDYIHFGIPVLAAMEVNDIQWEDPRYEVRDWLNYLATRQTNTRFDPFLVARNMPPAAPGEVVFSIRNQIQKILDPLTTLAIIRTPLSDQIAQRFPRRKIRDSETFCQESHNYFTDKIKANTLIFAKVPAESRGPVTVAVLLPDLKPDEQQPIDQLQ